VSQILDRTKVVEIREAIRLGQRILRSKHVAYLLSYFLCFHLGSRFFCDVRDYSYFLAGRSKLSLSRMPLQKHDVRIALCFRKRAKAADPKLIVAGS
jgi:hypothetical protein